MFPASMRVFRIPVSYTHLDVYKRQLLHGRGPEIPVRITLTGNITADFTSNFESAGINQTKHQIVMELNIHIYTYLSGAKAGADLTSSVPIAETVIVGETPQFFATSENASSKVS